MSDGSDAYVKVQKVRGDTKENEIKVAKQGPINKYFRYASKILKETEKFDSITIRASGNAIRKAIILVEDIKQKIGNLYQTNTIHTMTVIDEWQPKYIGLEVLK